MSDVQWSVTVSQETNDAALKYLAEHNEGIEGLSTWFPKQLTPLLRTQATWIVLPVSQKVRLTT